MNRILSVLVAVALCATATGVYPGSAWAQTEPEVFGIELVAHPDQQGMGRRGLVSIVAEVRAGSTIEREVIVSNRTRSRETVDVYVGDAIIDDSGFVPADGEGLVAEWATVEPASVILSPSERVGATVTLAVPEGAPNGEHYGVVWVQPPADDGGETGIGRVNRVGIRIYLNVVGGADVVGDPADGTDFVIETMEADTLQDGRRQVRARVRNTGQRALDLVGDLSLDEGPGNTSAGPFSTDGVTTLAIGGDGIVTVTMDRDLPDGPWLGRLLLSSGSVERAAEARFTFPATSSDSPDEVEAEMTPVEKQRRVLIPLVGTLIITLLVIALVLLLGRSRTRVSTSDEGDAPVSV